MKRYIIEDVKYGYLEIGIFSNRIVTIKYKEDDKSEWLTMVDGEGFPDTYLLDEDRFGDFSSPKHVKDTLMDMQEHIIYDFNGIDLCDYSDIFNGVTENPDNPASPLIKYLAALVNCPDKEIEDLVKLGIGKYADEVILPEKAVKQIDRNYLLFPEDVDKQFLYEMRYRLEYEIENMSIPGELAPEWKKSRMTTIESIKDRCNDEEDYFAWKQSYMQKDT